MFCNIPPQKILICSLIIWKRGTSPLLLTVSVVKKMAFKQVINVELMNIFVLIANRQLNIEANIPILAINPVPLWLLLRGAQKPVVFV